jgi:hypothetical protein
VVLIELSWPVPVDGFEWVPTGAIYGGTTQFGEWLAPICRGAPPPTRTWNVMNEPALFRNFAELTPTQGEVVEFANRFGPLTNGLAVVHIPDYKGGHVALNVETMDIWRGEIDDMRHLLSWWDHLGGTTANWFQNFLKVVSDESGPKLIHELRGSANFDEVVIVSENDDGAHVLASFRRGDIRYAAAHGLSTLLNKKMSAHRLSIRLHPKRGTKQDPVQKSARGPVAYTESLVPPDLLSALWLQFSQSVRGAKEYRQCEQCANWFELTAERRGDAKFCKEACRSRAYRARIAKSVRLHNEGVATTAIAEIVGADVKTIAGWIRGQKG